MLRDSYTTLTIGEELARKKKKVRAGHKSSASRMITKVEEILAFGNVPDHSKLNQLSMSLKEKLEEIKVLDSEILTLVSDDDLEDGISRANSFKECIYSTLIRIEETPGTTPAPAAPPVISMTLPTAAITHGNKVRLPKLAINPFKDYSLDPILVFLSSAVHQW